MRKILNHANFADHHTAYAGDYNVKPIWMLPRKADFGISLTVPGMAPEPEEIERRYRSGGQVKVFEGSYTVSDLLPDNFERMDQIDKIEYLKKVTALRMDTFGRLSKKSAERTAAAKVAAEEAAYQERKRKESTSDL